MTFDTQLSIDSDISAFHGFDVEEAYEDEVAENKRLHEIIEALTCSDSDKEIIRLSNKVKALEGRLSQSIKTETEAIKQTKHNTKLLNSIKKQLGVDSTTEILTTLKNGHRT